MGLCPALSRRGVPRLGRFGAPRTTREWALGCGTGEPRRLARYNPKRCFYFFYSFPFFPFFFFFLSFFPERPNLPRVYLPPRSPLISLKASLCIAAPVQNFERAACDGASASSPNYSSKILIKKSPAIGCHAGEGRHARPEAAQRPEASPRNIVLD